MFTSLSSVLYHGVVDLVCVEALSDEVRVVVFGGKGDLLANAASVCTNRPNKYAPRAVIRNKKPALADVATPARDNMHVVRPTIIP